MRWIRMPMRRPVGAAPLATAPEAAPPTGAPDPAVPGVAVPDAAVPGVAVPGVAGPGVAVLLAMAAGAAVAGAAVVLLPAVALADGAVRVVAVLLGAALAVVSGVAGYALRRLRAYRVAEAAGAARERDEQSDREWRAVLTERVRIARELHDVVAHHMSVISVQAGLARYVLSSDPATAQRALHAVAEMSSEGLAEVRRLVTVLRPDLERGGERSPDRDTPGVEALPAMIERVGLTGVAIEFTVCGEARPLPAGVELCVYRVVQESLTNAIKHARGARVTVVLGYEQDRVGVRITNDGRGGQVRRSAPRTSPGGGKGLVGMYERAMLYGGTLTAGGLPQGGFEVVLTLPIQPAPPSSDSDRTPTESGARP